jgi:SAM-dependent methyltransferase
MRDSVSGTDRAVSGSPENAPVEAAISALPLRDHYADGAWYDAEYVHVGADVEPWTEWARSCGRSLLELGCGTGRLCLPAAAAGMDVLGVDRSPSMLAQAERKRRALPTATADRLRFRRGDMRTLRLEQRFDAVLVGLNGLMHMLEDADLDAALRTIAHHLTLEGRAGLDVFAAGPEWSTGENPVDPQQLIDSEGRRWWVEERRWFDPRRQRCTMQLLYRRDEDASYAHRSEVVVRSLSEAELDRALDRASLCVHGDYDDVARTRRHVVGGPRRVLVVGRRP